MQRIFNIHYTVAFIDGRHNKSEYIKSIFKIRKLIKEQDFDLIHVHYGFSGLFLLAGKLPKKDTNINHSAWWRYTSGTREEYTSMVYKANTKKSKCSYYFK